MAGKEVVLQFLTQRVTDMHLREIAEKVGHIEKAHIKDSIGFVTFGEQSTAEKFVECFNGGSIDNMQLKAFLKTDNKDLLAVPPSKDLHRSTTYPKQKSFDYSGANDAKYTFKYRRNGLSEFHERGSRGTRRVEYQSHMQNRTRGSTDNDNQHLNDDRKRSKSPVKDSIRRPSVYPQRYRRRSRSRDYAGNNRPSYYPYKNNEKSESNHYRRRSSKSPQRGRKKYSPVRSSDRKPDYRLDYAKEPLKGNPSPKKINEKQDNHSDESRQTAVVIE